MKRSFEAVRFSGAGLFFAGAAVLALLAGASVYSILNSAVQTETVLVVTRDIPPGGVLTERDLELKTIPAGGAPDRAIRSKSQAVAQRARYGLTAGDVVRAGHLVQAGSDLAHQVAQMGNEYRVVMLPGELVPGLDRLVPGDQLELTGILPHAEKQNSTTLSLPLGTATVVDIPQSRSGGEKSTVLVALTAEQVSRLALTQRAGSLMIAVLGHEQSTPPQPPMRLDLMTGEAAAVRTPVQTGQ